MKLVNLTGHPLNFTHLDIILPPHELCAKVTQRHDLVSMTSGIPVFDITYLGITGLPDPEEGTIYIVSAPVLNGVRELYPDRTDVVATFKPIKNPATGQTVGCGALRLKG